MDRQMSGQSYEIVFIGQDFKPVKEAAERAEITYKGEKYYIGNNNEILLKNDSKNDTQNDKQDEDGGDLPKPDRSDLADKRNLLAYQIILEKFLEQVTDRGGAPKTPIFRVNRSEDKKGREKLYSVFNNELYFSGIVGVIKKQITVNLDRETGKQEAVNQQEEVPEEEIPEEEIPEEADQEEESSEEEALKEEIQEENDQDKSSEQKEKQKEQPENGKILTFNVTLQIKSRLDAMDEKGTPGKPYFLSKMLLRDKIRFSDNNVPESEDELLDYLLLFWFRQQLQEALQKGYYKTYRRFARNDDKLKGSINIAEHIRLNMGRKNGKIAYTYRENTVSNYLNLLLITAYEYMKKKYHDLVVENFDSNTDLKKAIDFIKREVQELQTDTGTVINKNLKPISHSYFTEYEQLRITCLKILRDEGASIFDGDPEDENQSILFYLPDLWELYIRDEMLAQLPDSIALKDQEKIMNFGYQDEKQSDHAKEMNDSNNDNHTSDTDKDRQESSEREDSKVSYTYKQMTFPDYVFYDTTRSDEWTRFMIFDAKFKPKWELVLDNKEKSVSSVMEDYNKCLRDMCAINAGATGVIFPTNKTFEMNNRTVRHPVAEYNEDSFFYTIPVHIPLAADEIPYSEWDEKFSSSVEESKNVMDDILKEEWEYAQEVLVFRQKMHEIRIRRNRK